MSKIIKNNCRLVISALVLMLVMNATQVVMAQSESKMKSKADAFFQKKDYYSSAKWYAAILYDSPVVNKTIGLVYPFQHASHSIKPKIDESEKNLLLFQLAESYRLYNHYLDALPQYEQYITSLDSRFPLSRLWYGVCLLANNQPEKAIPVFNFFLQKHKADDEYRQKGLLGLADCKFVISSKAQSAEADISKLPSTASSDGSSFAMQKMNYDNNFWFTSSRHEINPKNELIFPARIYSGYFNSKRVEKIAGFPDDLNMAASFLVLDGLTVYFTGWKEDQKNPQALYQLYYAKRSSVDSKWNLPVLLPSSVNAPGYNAKQPFITSDNKYLLFVSDQPGGYGKYDIWRIALDQGSPAGKAVNLGSKINSKENEASPFYDAATGNLYFSSDGRTGMGGMDIYQVNGDIALNQWNDPVSNLGYPINSVKNDLYFSKEGKSDTAYLSSDRASACCLEIFQAVLKKKGKDSSVKPVDSGMIVKQDIPVIIAVDSIVMADNAGRKALDSLNAVTIERIQVNYRFASTRIRAIDYTQLDYAVKLLSKNPALNILIASFTDCIGSVTANKLLSRKRSESVKAYLIKKGIPASRINLDFFGKQHLILACVEDKSYITEKQIANRRSELIITTDKTPKWTPTGRELDLPNNRIDSVTRSLNQMSLIAGSEKKNLIPVNTSVTKTTKPNDDINKVNNAAESIAGKQTVTGNKRRLMEDSAAISKKSNTDYSGKEASAYRKMNTEKVTDDAANGNKEKIKNDKPANTSKYSVISKSDSNTASNKKSGVVSDRPIAVYKSVEKTIVPSKSRKLFADSLHTNMNITQLMDLTPRLQKPSVIEQMTSRTPRKSFQVYTTSDSVKVELYDNGVFDYDTVSVIYNKELVVYKQMLQTTKPISFYVKLNSDQSKNEMIFFAENLGLTPPNSALMVITDGDRKRTEVNVSSDLEHNSVIYFIKVKK